MAEPESAKPNHQVVGNVGLFYVCYRLSRQGWNVMPTARNAKGIDIVIYSQDAKKKFTIQVKALTYKNPVPLGSSPHKLFGDFLIICRNVGAATPECFVLTPEEARNLAYEGKSGSKPNFWLQPKHYDNDGFREKWERIGHGSSPEVPNEQPLE